MISFKSAAKRRKKSLKILINRISRIIIAIIIATRGAGIIKKLALITP